MDFIDYREKLGLGFNDNQKFTLLCNKIFGVFSAPEAIGSMCLLSNNDYFDFCFLTGNKIQETLIDKSDSNDRLASWRFSNAILFIQRNSDSLEAFLLYYLSFANSVQNEEPHICNRRFLIDFLQKSLTDVHIQYKLLKDNEEYFIFPKGAEELDNALVSEPLQWLEDYPKAHGTFSRALRQYSDGEHTRDVADNFRKALEEFLQEYLGNSKNLESNKNEICKHLGSKGVDAEFGGLLQPLLNTYKNINDKYAKHNDAMDERLLEFIMYQTGVFIRMIISVKE